MVLPMNATDKVEGERDKGISDELHTRRELLAQDITKGKWTYFDMHA